MGDTKTINCSLVTPDRQVLDCEAKSVTLTAHDGQIGFLANRAPLLCKLGVGELRVTTQERVERFFVDGGFAQMLNNQLTLLTPSAEAAQDMDPADCDAQLHQAQALPGGDERLRTAKDQAITRARARHRVAHTDR